MNSSYGHTRRRDSVSTTLLRGGAGRGATSRSIAQYLDDGGRVYAFEPFPGNHRFFSDQEKAICLIPKALSGENRKMNFYVRSVVPADSVWGRKGLAGYSSTGHLLEDGAPRRRGDIGGQTIEVECTTGDSAISDKVSFVKLDLQGGELNALKGIPRIINESLLMWIEFTGRDREILGFLSDRHFRIFDTQYCFKGPPTDAIARVFDISGKQLTLSTGGAACLGFKKAPWRDFETEFFQLKKEIGLMQTDMVCVNERFIGQFRAALAQL